MPDRVSIDIRLKGMGFPDGEIPLAALGDIAASAQEFVTRLARSIVGREGPGRTPITLGHEVQLSLRGIRPGSTVLELVGPAQQSLDLGDDLDLTRQVFEQVVEGLDALAHDRQLPDAYTPLVRESCRGFLRSMSASGEVDIESSVGDRMRMLSIDPTRAQQKLTTRSEPQRQASRVAAVEGIVVLVDLDRARFAIRDDVGHRIYLRPGEVSSAAIAALIGQRVVAVGESADEGELITELVLVSIRSEDRELGFDAAAFKRPLDLVELVQDVRPLSRGGLDLGLDADEAAAFLDVIAETP